MDQAGARFSGDVIPANHDRAGALQERMAVLETFEGGSFDADQGFEGQAQAGFEAFAQFGGHHQVAGSRCGVVALGLNGADGVLEPFIDGDRQVRGQRPGGRGPDGHSQAAVGRGLCGGEARLLEGARQAAGEFHRGEGGKDTR